MIGYAVLIGRGLLQIEIDDFCGSSTSLISSILGEKGVCDSISEWEGRLQTPPSIEVGQHSVDRQRFSWEWER